MGDWPPKNVRPNGVRCCRILPIGGGQIENFGYYAEDYYQQCLAKVP